jgi:hypothetical protein
MWMIKKGGLWLIEDGRLYKNVNGSELGKTNKRTGMLGEKSPKCVAQARLIEQIVSIRTLLT